MAYLTGPEMKKQVEAGNIVIDPFDPDRCGPNSYDVCLAPPIWKMSEVRLDIKVAPTRYTKEEIPPEGYELQPGRGYLGVLKERIYCEGFVPWIDGRSTLGRYFVIAHVTAGRGDDGWEGHLTMELVSLCLPTVIYANIPIFQITFSTLQGERQPYQGRYNGQGPVPTPPKPFC